MENNYFGVGSIAYWHSWCKQNSTSSLGVITYISVAKVTLMKKIDKKQRDFRKTAELSAQSMATLAGGMAEDFNNILTTVMGACTLIKKDDPENDELLQCVALIRASAEHAAMLTDRLAHVSLRETDAVNKNS